MWNCQDIILKEKKCIVIIFNYILIKNKLMKEIFYLNLYTNKTALINLNKITELEARPPLKKCVFCGQVLIKLRSL